MPVTGGEAGAGGAEPTEHCPDGYFDDDPSDIVHCSAWRTCIPGEYVANDPSELVDRICVSCKYGTFSSFADQEQCFEWTICGPGQNLLEPGTATTDTLCRSFGLIPEYEQVTDIAANLQRVYVTGYVPGSFAAPDAVVFDAAGKRLDTWTFDPDQQHIARGIATDSAGMVYVAGARWQAQQSPEFFLRKVDESGRRLWETSLDVASIEQWVELEVGPDDSLYVARALYTGLGSSTLGYLVSRYSADGQLLWATETSNGNAFEGYHDFLAVDELGNAYVTGDTIPALPAVRLTSSGALDATWAPEASGITTSSVVAARDRYVDIAGEVAPPVGPQSFRIARYETSGRLVWSYDFHDSACNALIEAANGDLYSIATYLGSSSSLITRLSSDGAWLGQRMAFNIFAGAWGEHLYVGGRHYSLEDGNEGLVFSLPIE
ncbi:MAG TPA: hypothetical protein VER04_04205 [Polyangiaceae bacterium]|nr:hypothetical protein [Polyangiaceae bacterium]